MRVVTVHNFYRQPGGEDEVFRDEAQLLQDHGHEVNEFALHNDSISEGSPLSLALRTTWNSATYARLRALFLDVRPDVAHFHNTFPLVSPAAYYAARSAGVPVVQTIHNFRLVCAGATLARAGAVCELCLQRRFKWPAIAHGCYRENRLATAAVVAMQGAHALVGTWRNAIDVYVALTEFARAKLAEGGIPADRIVVKPNFCNDPGMVGSGSGGFALFVGRLAADKGIATLLDAWRQLEGRVPLKIAGDGPMMTDVRRAAAVDPSIEVLGAVRRERVQALMRDARFSVVPSLWYEMFPRVVAESFALGTPVLASRIGSLQGIVNHGSDGVLFKPGDAVDLARSVLHLVSAPEVLKRLRAGARRTYEAKMSPEGNYRDLIDIYSGALRARQESQPQALLGSKIA